jgi:hypothetical protein
MKEDHQMLIDVINRESVLSLKFTEAARESLSSGSFEIGTNSLRRAEEHHHYLLWLVNRLIELEQTAQQTYSTSSVGL